LKISVSLFFFAKTFAIINIYFELKGINMKEEKLPMGVKLQIEPIAFACIPLLACMLFAALQGIALWEVSPFASLWNDEVFYYEQIEAMVKFGAPLGYFGYNGSFAEVGTLGAWPAFVLFPYVLLGYVFGISPFHMIVFNIMFMMLAFGTFYYLAKPEKWQCFVIALLFFTFPASMRYLMSGMVEALFNAAIVVLVGFLIYFQRGKYGRVSLGISYFIVFYFAVCRPWFLIFVFIPAFYHFKLHKAESVVASLVTMGAFAGVYVFYAMPRCAAYLYDTINLQIFETLLGSGVFAFLKEVIKTTVYDGMGLVSYLLSFNTFYAASIISFLVLLGLIVVSVLVRKKQVKTFKDEKLITGIMAIFVCICIVWALVLFYTEEQVARHIMSLIIALQMLLVIYFLPKNKALIIALVVMFGLVGWQYRADGYTFALPKEGGAGSVMTEEAKDLQNAFEVVEGQSPWQNTVLYAYPNVNTNYCYYLPEGVGLNLCLESYINEVYATTDAKYILTNYNEGTYLMYTECGWNVIAQGQQFMLYEKQ